MRAKKKMGTGSSKQQQERGYRLAEVIVKDLFEILANDYQTFVKLDFESNLKNICENYPDVCSDEKSKEYIQLAQQILKLTSNFSKQGELRVSSMEQLLRSDLYRKKDWTVQDIATLTGKINSFGGLLPK